jgi:hypothetical protein
MASSRTRLACALVLLALFTALGARLPARAQFSELTIVVTDAASWRTFAGQHPQAVGLGVFPDSRDPPRFIEEIGNGAPNARPGARSVVKGSPGALTRALARARINVLVRGDPPPRVRAAIEKAFPPVVFPGIVSSLDVVYATGVNVGRFAGPAIVLGIDARTPVWVEICDGNLCLDDESAVVTGGIARRPAIVTPYDIAATILDHFGVARSETFIGNPLHSEADPNALARITHLAKDLERSSGLGATMGATATVMAIAALALGLLLRALGRRDLSARTAQIAGCASTGYLVALFVPTASGTLRALVLGLATVVLMAVAGRRPLVDTGRLLLGAAALFALLVAVAPLRPGGLPGAAIWGNPLKSWRFVGVQNFEVSIVASAVVVWGVMAGLRARSFAVVAFGATIVVGAPTVGSNFVGVLTIAFGAALAGLALARRRVEIWQAIAAAAVAAVAFALSLLADAASPVSHGGRAARRIGEGGFSTLVDFVEARLRLNVDLIRGFKGGVVFAVALIGVALASMVYGTRSAAPNRARVAVWAGAAMGLSSLVLEDSGFYSGAIMLVAAVAGWMLATASDEPDVLSSPSDPRPAGGG